MVYHAFLKRQNLKGYHCESDMPLYKYIVTYSESQIYEYIARVFYNVVLHI